MNTKTFRILLSGFSREDKTIARECGVPESVPWELLAPHEKQALCNHDQTLQRLNERGGLSPCEMVAVLEDRRYRSMSMREAAHRLKFFLDQHAAKASGDS